MSKKATLKQRLGIDVSMKKIDCCLSFYTEDLKIKVVATSGFENSPDGFIKLREWLNRKQDNGALLCMSTWKRPAPIMKKPLILLAVWGTG